MGVVVDTQQGKLEGVEEAGVQVFRGIPFARPPVGPLRFRPPEPAEPWGGVRDAQHFGSSAPQDLRQPVGFAKMGVGPESEDCC